MKKYITLFLMVLFMTGCFGSQTAKRYYQLQVPIPAGVQTDMIDRVIYVDTVYTEDIYDDFRMVYRISPFQINYYSYDFWVKKPGVMLKNSLVGFFQRAGIFKRVIDKLADSEPDLILKSKLYAIEEDDSKSQWYARLSMDIEIADFNNPKTVYVSHRFDRKKPLPDKNVNTLPQIISEILSEELERVARKLSVQMK